VAGQAVRSAAPRARLVRRPAHTFRRAAYAAGLFHGACACTFHEGIDISARDGTPVYPVASGTVTVVRTAKAEEMVRVESGGTAFEYWHIVASVRVGEKVEASRTVLGHIIREAGHVHLTEIDGGLIVNPLEPGHLAPYRDVTRPVVNSISFRSRSGSDVMANFLRGSVEIVADAADMPSMPVPGLWHGMPVTPAVVSWRIERWNGKVVLDDRVAYDVRRTIPSNTTFWQVYARGTYQNMSVFGNHYSWLQPGCFLFRLTPQGFDTRTLRDGVYVVVVTATDIAGNTDSRALRFTVHNRPGFTG
jgi:Peptidase family M23